MAYELKVVSGSTNVLLLINGKGVPAQKERAGDELYRFLVRDDRLGEFFPEYDELLDSWSNQAKTIYEQFGRIKDLEQLVRDAYWLIVRAIWSHESQGKFAADWTERVSVLGIEVD